MSKKTGRADNSLEIHWSILVTGAAIGSVLSWLVLTGDQQGMINLFYLLLIYLFIPVVSVVISLFSLFLGDGINLARLLMATPLFSIKSSPFFRKLHQLNLDKYWFLYQSQAAAIAFSVASLLVYFTLLLITDLNFVWRSTILGPSDILPWLKAIALPWQFWDGAQPNLALLEITRDSRVAENLGQQADYGRWWKFILATQMCYSIILRLLLMLITYFRFNAILKSDFEQELKTQISNKRPIEQEAVETSPVVSDMPGSDVINNWDSIPLEVLNLLPGINPENINTNLNRRQSSVDEQLLIVKAWEPPMGELEDYLQDGRGYLLPLDWNDAGLCQLRVNHFHEWQRIINKFPSWKLFIPKGYAPDES